MKKAKSNLFHGDCLEVIKDFDDNSIDTIITDPPYNLVFMVKDWDKSGISFQARMWESLLRVAKPGAFLLCFGGTRTYHRIACAIEDGGWQIRDSLMWLYANGFPKSRNFSKSIADPDLSKEWEGWGTCLRPSWEPIIVAMKSMNGTFDNNALKHCVAGLNINGSRIRYQSEADKNSATPQGKCTSKEISAIGAEPDAGRDLERVEFDRPSQLGRWPANVILSHHPDCERSGSKKVKGTKPHPVFSKVEKYGGWGNITQKHGEVVNKYEDADGYEQMENWKCHPDCPVMLLDSQSTDVSYNKEGGASRFFYVTKASKKERNEGLPKGVENTHPTVKPLRLMEYLCTLTSSPCGGVVLDPFMGSGSTGVACRNINRPFVGIEMDEESFRISKYRIKYRIKRARTDIFENE